MREVGLEAVMTYSDHLSDETRRRSTEHLQCKIIDCYASNECGTIAITCAVCGHLHVQAETIHAEVIGDDGRLCPPGDTGWVIVTPLYNFAMPLIRYHHADQARVGEHGQCPITLPVLDSVIGKEPVMFTFRGGVQVRPFIPPAAIISNLGAQIFQVAQVAEDRCEFRIVPGRIPPSEMHFEKLTQVLRERWWNDLEVDYRIIDELPAKDRRRKPVAFVREFLG